ncbi:MAG TPA: GNAT family N-acetyltransferase [Methylomirabilota bacterium]|nr:GNAT family N-acetyltransferase [Methylomirabilota bacterium]
MIRRALPAEAPALTRIAHAAKRHWRYPEDWIALWRDALTVTPWFVERAPVYCAEAGGALAGFYALIGRAPTTDLEHCWVRPAYIGRGIGARLVAHAAKTARAAGATTLRIASDPFAEGFYRRMGARPAGTVPSTPRGRTLPLLLLKL